MISIENESHMHISTTSTSPNNQFVVSVTTIFHYFWNIYYIPGSVIDALHKIFLKNLKIILHSRIFYPHAANEQMRMFRGQ